MSNVYDFKHLNLFTAFVIERHAIYQRRRKGQLPPWTTDKILAAYRFCNVYRELDRTTQWITEHWRMPHEDNADLWFWMVIARMVNHPPTLQHLGQPGRWNRKQFTSVIHAMRASGKQAFGGAYIIPTGGASGDKAESIAKNVLDPMWTARASIRPVAGELIQRFFERLRGCNGMGSFMAGQVVADIKYAPPLLTARDWWTFASSGPGSRRGMAYVLGYAPDIAWKEHEWKEALMELSVLTRPIFSAAKIPRIHNQDLQNCLCEFSKYRRTQLGTGRPKQKFTPFTGVE